MINKIYRGIGLAAVAIVATIVMLIVSMPVPVADAAVAWALTRAGSAMSIDSAGAISLAPKAGKAVTVTRNLNVTGDVAVNTNKANITASSGNATFAGSVGIGGGAPIVKVLTGTASVDFTALAAGACENFNITVTGAADGDPVQLGIPAAAWATTEYATIDYFVSAPNTVTVKRCNLTNATTALSNPAPVTIRAAVFQF
jgi:hypothetical protein